MFLINLDLEVRLRVTTEKLPDQMLLLHIKDFSSLSSIKFVCSHLQLSRKCNIGNLKGIYKTQKCGKSLTTEYYFLNKARLL